MNKYVLDTCSREMDYRSWLALWWAAHALTSTFNPEHAYSESCKRGIVWL